MFWKNIPIHILDFEGSVNSGIVEYGFATLLGGKVIDARTRICGVKSFIPLEESEVHGIFNEDVIGLAPVENDWNIFSGLRQSGLFGSHHAPAEIGMLGSVWSVPGKVPDFSITGCPPVNSWGPWIDTCRIAKTWFPQERSHKLSTLIERFEIGDRVEKTAEKFCPKARARYHCALYDAIAAAELLINMCEHPSFERAEILDLVSASPSAKKFREHLQGEFDFF